MSKLDFVMERPHLFSSFSRTLRFRRFALVLAFFIGALIYWTALPSTRGPEWWPDLHLPSFTSHHTPDDLKCQSLKGANETLVVMRTGSTELAAKLSVHLDTVLRCFPHKLLFSDTAEIFNGHTVLDALESVSSTVKETNEDFILYNRLRDGRQALESDELHGKPNETLLESLSGHTENPGWKLEKWKFLPMVNRTFSEYPDTAGIEWYVFMEADSYIVWPTLLDHLATLDHTKPYYSGSAAYIDSVAFAHGGSTFIVSPPAMRPVTEYYNAHKEEVEETTNRHWAGDCVLAMYFAESGTPLTGAWPTFQGEHPGSVAYMESDSQPGTSDIWCAPAVSYHHVDSSTIKDLWNFEQEQIWLSSNVSSTTRQYRQRNSYSPSTRRIPPRP
jgi:hypothetical protein